MIDRAGRSLIQSIFQLSAEQVAGPKTLGKTKGEVCWHGRQASRVRLADRQVKVERPRPRSKRGEEVAVPAYQALRGSEQTGAEMFEAVWAAIRSRIYLKHDSRIARDSTGGITLFRRSR